MSTRNNMSRVPDPSTLNDFHGVPVWGWFKRLPGGSVHCLPLSTDYAKKRLEDGSPAFIRVADSYGNAFDEAVVEPPRLDYSVDTTTRRSGKPPRKD